MQMSDHWLLLVTFWLISAKTFNAAYRFWTSRKERFAAKIEWDDENTSERRRSELLAKYGDELVPPPAHRFQVAAQELVKADTFQVRSVLIFYAIIALLAFLCDLAFKAIF